MSRRGATGGGGAAGNAAINACQVAGNASVNSAPTNASNNYVAISTANFGVLSASSAFALTAAGCKLTYSGPTKRFLARVIASIEAGGAVTGIDVYGCGIDQNGDLIGQTFNSIPQAAGISNKGAQLIGSNIAGGLDGTCFASERIVTLANNDTIQPAYARWSGSTNAITILLDQLTLTVLELPGTS